MSNQIIYSNGIFHNLRAVYSGFFFVNIFCPSLKISQGLQSCRFHHTKFHFLRLLDFSDENKRESWRCDWSLGDGHAGPYFHRNSDNILTFGFSDAAGKTHGTCVTRKNHRQVTLKSFNHGDPQWSLPGLMLL